MSDIVDRVRAFVYQAFARAGSAPSPEEIARGLGESHAIVRAAIRVLADRHALILTPDRRAIERALPFADVPTAFRVRPRDAAKLKPDGGWWANCIWDALSIPALLERAAVIETTCADCGTGMAVSVDPSVGPDQPELLAHFLLPARRWYEDIRFT